MYVIWFSLLTLVVVEYFPEISIKNYTELKGVKLFFVPKKSKEIQDCQRMKSEVNIQ